MNSLERILFFLLVLWFSGLGLSALVGALSGRNGGSDGARWWVRVTGQFLRGFMREILEGVGRSFINIIMFIHNSFYARFPVGTMVFYGVIVLLFILGLFFK